MKAVILFVTIFVNQVCGRTVEGAASICILFVDKNREQQKSVRMH
jgi:hypothetical protein